MISKQLAVILISFSSIASYANCDWLFYSEKTLIEAVQLRWTTDLESFRNLDSNEHQLQYLKSFSEKIESKLKAISKRPAVHFNLHGGQGPDYIEAGGIRASQGDVGQQYGISRDSRHKVYSFNLEMIDLYSVLTFRNPSNLFFRQRMGSLLIFFDLDAEPINRYKETGLISSENQITLNFSGRKEGLFYGVPKESFIADPIRVFDQLHKGLGPRWLSYNEKTLFALVMIDVSLSRP